MVRPTSADSLTRRFLDRMVTEGPFSLPRLAASDGDAHRSLFLRAGTCDLTHMRTADELEELAGHYLVWYKRNRVGADNWWADSSPNYRLQEYVDGLVVGSLVMPPRVSEIVGSLRGGLTEPIEIMVAEDTTLGVAIIVDGTNRAVAMRYLKRTDLPALDRLLGSEHLVQVLRLRSAVASLLFPCDFLKLWLASQRGVGQ